MDYYRIEGGRPLRGEYRVKGAKNAALPILAASLCRPGIHEIYGCPRIGDSLVLTQILKELGAGVTWEEDCLVVDSRSLTGNVVPRHLMEQLRSSVFLLGSLLARTGEATIHRPGGCRIGKRPIDIHIDGLQQLGFQIEEEGDGLRCLGRCRGGRVRLAYPSVGATENLMMAALSGEELTVLENCAAEPEVADLQGFLRTCGYQVYGAGGTRITIQGQGEEAGLKGTVGAGFFCASGSSFCRNTMYFIMEDRIEAATYLMALAGTGGEGVLTNIRPRIIEPVLQVLTCMGAEIRREEDRIGLRAPAGLSARATAGLSAGLTGKGSAGPAARLKSPGTVVTAPYPGFPTDCQPQLLTLATVAEGRTVIQEEIFESRFTHKKELMKMGADIETCGKNAIIRGIDILKGADVTASDLRGGGALVLAGLMAQGVTTVKGIHHIERGYEGLWEGLRSLGGKIEEARDEEKKKENEPADEAADFSASGGGHRGGHVPAGLSGNKL